MAMNIDVETVTEELSILLAGESFYNTDHVLTTISSASGKSNQFILWVGEVGFTVTVDMMGDAA